MSLTMLGKPALTTKTKKGGVTSGMQGYNADLLTYEKGESYDARQFIGQHNHKLHRLK